jgi:Alpha/beta hydrolase domain
MCQKTSRMFRYLVSAFGLGAVIGLTSPSDAYVQKIVIDQKVTANFTPITLGTSTPSSATSYTIYTGRIFGELKPNDPDNNKIITDIDLAPKNNGRVQYIANFEVITPTDPTARSGLMIQEVPNRGNNAINTSALIQGATYVQSGWQGDLLSQCSPSPAIPYPCFDLNKPYGALNTTTGVFTPPTVPDVAGAGGVKSLASFVVQVPVATNPNGKNPITGTVYSHVCTGTNGCGLVVGSAPTSTAQLEIQGPAFAPYHPASMDTTQAEFWTVSSQTFEGVDSAKTPIPSNQWAWAYCPSGWPGTPNPNWICLKNATFDPTLLYEMVYTAKNPLVLGVGFAAFRDLGSFLRYETSAPGGGSNPISPTVKTTYTVGASQSGAFIHGFIFWGFNKDEDDRIVFDGAWPQIDGRMMVMNIRWGQPNNLMYLYVGGDEAPVWWADYPNLARGLPPNGMLHRCTKSNTCPQIVETFGSAELYSEKFSASLCGFTCIADIPLPSNVHRYYSPGATHGGGSGDFTWAAPGTAPPAGQSLLQDPIPESFTNNALTYAFIQLLMSGTPMPPSVYPTLANGELVPNTAAAEGFPNIPGVPYQGDQAWPPFVYDFGPGENYDQESGIPTIQPPIIDSVLPVYATKVNKDGNEDVTGLPTVLGEAPLGTYVGWNLATTGWYGPNASNGPGSVGQVFAGAGNSGGYWPFWDTQANRAAADDPRLSLEERYGTHDGYVCVVTAAANAAVQARFLLPSDATMLISNATNSNVLGSPYVPTSADMNLANSLCSQ